MGIKFPMRAIKMESSALKASALIKNALRKKALNKSVLNRNALNNSTLNKSALMRNALIKCAFESVFDYFFGKKCVKKNATMMSVLIIIGALNSLKKSFRLKDG